MATGPGDALSRLTLIGRKQRVGVIDAFCHQLPVHQVGAFRHRQMRAKHVKTTIGQADHRWVMHGRVLIRHRRLQGRIRQIIVRQLLKHCGTVTKSATTVGEVDANRSGQCRYIKIGPAGTVFAMRIGHRIGAAHNHQSQRLFCCRRRSLQDFVVGVVTDISYCYPGPLLHRRAGQLLPLRGLNTEQQRRS